MGNKIILSVFACLLFTDSIQAQFSQFDSAYTAAYSENYDYFNPEFEKPNSSNYFDSKYITLSYEKHDTNGNNSNIVFRKVLFNSLEDEVMITNDNFRNTEPAAGHSIILWQSDKNGNNDIYYSTYNGAGWADASPLQITTEDETEPDVAEYNVSGFPPAYLITYKAGNEIHFKVLHENIVIFDTVLTSVISEACSLPKIKMYNSRILIGYLKNVNSINKFVLIKAEINSSYAINWTSSEEISNLNTVEDFRFCNAGAKKIIMIYDYDTLGSYKNIGIYEDETDTKLILNNEPGTNISGKASVFLQSIPFYSPLSVFCWLKRSNDSSMIVATSNLIFNPVRKIFYAGDSSQNTRLDLSSYFYNQPQNAFRYRLIWEQKINNRSALRMSQCDHGSAGIQTTSTLVPREFHLEQNYPNP
ncbi:MAG: hypothetical protein ABIY50_01140, partial [Ignavibacteria bacterium]